MSDELVPQKKPVVRRTRRDIPREHRTSDDARIQWLWNQKLIVVQNIWQNTDNIQDKMAATLILNAAYSGDLTAIELVLKRLEGGPVLDQVIQDSDGLIL